MLSALICSDSIHSIWPAEPSFGATNSVRDNIYGPDDMYKSSFSTGSDLDDTALGWATSQCASLPPRQKNVLFNLFFTRFGKTSRKAARAVRDFVTCSSPQSNGFAEDVTTTSQESPIDLQSSQDEIPSTTSNLQLPRDKPVRDVWSIRNGVSPPRGFIRQQNFRDGSRHPSHCHWTSTHGRVAAHAECNHRASGAEVKLTSSCGPKLPSNFFELPTRQRLRDVKQFLAGFVYKPNSETSFQANKQRPLCRLMATARMIVYKPEPIKSVEAVFLALYLTAGLLSVDRIPVGFKIKFEDEVSQHIVVLVQHNGKYGAFGISSYPDLMTKDLKFTSMSSIIENYMKAYKASAHTVLKIRVGLPVEHDVMSTHFVCWRHLCLSPDVKSWAECVVEIENHVLRMRRLWDLWVLTGKGDDPRKAKMAKRKADANFTPRAKPTEKPQEVVPSEVEKPVEKPSSRKQTPQAVLTPKHCDADAESTGSNTEECEHCEQLRRAIPPSETKRACVTTAKVKRIKTADRHHDTARDLTPRKKIHGHQFTLSSHHSSEREQQWEAESFESNTGDSSAQPRLNHMSLAATKQILKYFVSSSVLSTPPRRFTRRSGTRDPIRRKADPKKESGRRKNLSGPLYNLAIAQAQGGTRSKAG